MENFNNIPNSGTYGAAIALINANFQLTKEQLERLEHSREGFCGMYNTSTALQAAYPNPTTGSFAYVGTDFPMSVYLVSNGAWYESSQEYDGGSIDLTQYASASSVTALASRVATLEDAGYLLAGVANPSVAPDSSNHDKRYMFAWTPGTYSSYGQFTIADGEFGILIYNGSSWSLSKTDLIAKSIVGGYDTEPTENSTKPITSGAVYDALEDIGDTIPNVSNFGFAEVVLYPEERINIALRYAQEAIAGFTLLSATASKAGLLSAADKAKVDAFLGNLRSIVFADTTASADQSTKITETLKITVNGVQEAVTTLQLLAATTSKAGLLSASDKAKIDNILTNIRSMAFADTTASADLGTKIVESLKWTVGGTQEVITTLQILAATSLKAGLMSSTDKARLEELWADGYKYIGIATPSTTPISTTSKIFYIATEAGTYFNAVTVTQGINILKYNGTSWSGEQIISIDDKPASGSNNLVKSGGIYKQEAELISSIQPKEKTTLELGGLQNNGADLVSAERARSPYIKGKFIVILNDGYYIVNFAGYDSNKDWNNHYLNVATAGLNSYIFDFENDYYTRFAIKKADGSDFIESDMQNAIKSFVYLNATDSYIAGCTNNFAIFDNRIVRIGNLFVKSSNGRRKIITINNTFIFPDDGEPYYLLFNTQTNLCGIYGVTHEEDENDIVLLYRTGTKVFVCGELYQTYIERMQSAITSNVNQSVKSICEKSNIPIDLSGGHRRVNYLTGEYESSTSSTTYANQIELNGDEMVIGYYSPDFESSPGGFAFLDANEDYMFGQRSRGAFNEEKIIDAQTIRIAYLNGAKYLRLSLYYNSSSGKYPAIIKYKLPESYNTSGTDITKINQTITIGSQSLYSSPARVDAPNFYDTTTIDDVYDALDTLVAEHSGFIRRESDLGLDSDNLPIRHYMVGWMNPTFCIEDYGEYQRRFMNGYANDASASFMYRRAFISAGVHGGERGSVWGLVYFLQDLLSSDDEWARFIKGNFVLDIVPIICPWAYINKSRTNKDGINVNRDYIIKDSEEATAIINYLNLIKGNISCIIDSHTYYGNMGFFGINQNNPQSSTLVKVCSELIAAKQKDWETNIKDILPIVDSYKAPYCYVTKSVNSGTLSEVGMEYTPYAITVESVYRTDGNIAILAKQTADMIGNILQSFLTIIPSSDNLGTLDIFNVTYSRVSSAASMLQEYPTAVQKGNGLRLPVMVGAPGHEAITVTMGNTDITSQVYSDGLINIPFVTGDVHIEIADEVLPSGYQTTALVTKEGKKIDTGIYGNQNTEITVLAKAVMSSSAANHLFGDITSQSKSISCPASNSNTLTARYGSQSVSNYPVFNVWSSQGYSLLSCDKNGVRNQFGEIISWASVPSAFTTDGTLYIGAANGSTGKDGNSILSACIIKDGTTLFCARAAKRLADNAIGLYDYISQSFFELEA